MESADNTQNEKTNGQGQPVQYYTNAINIMCYYIMKKAASHDLTKNGIEVFFETTAQNRKLSYLQDSFCEIDKCAEILYNYSKEMGFIPQDCSFDDFLKEHGYTYNL